MDIKGQIIQHDLGITEETDFTGHTKIMGAVREMPDVHPSSSARRALKCPGCFAVMLSWVLLDRAG